MQTNGGYWAGCTFGYGAMASIPGSHYDIYAGGQTIHFGIVSGSGDPPLPILGDFNIEVITSPPTGHIKTPDGYQGVVLLSESGNALWALHGDYQVVDNGGNDSIFAGDGNVSIIGGAGDTIVGATGPRHRTDDSDREKGVH